MLDETIIVNCKDVVLEYYSDNQLLRRRLNIFNEDIFKNIKSIFLYDKYEENILKEYLLNRSQLSSDIETLNYMFRYSQRDIQKVLDRIENNIQIQDESYFVNQSKVIHLYDTLVKIEYIHDYKEELFDISKKLYKFDIEYEYKKFDENDWTDFQYGNAIGCSNKLSYFINKINTFNFDTYFDKVFNYLREGINYNDTDKILKVIPKCRKDMFIFLFEFCIKYIDKGIGDQYLNIILELFHLTDIKDIKEYFNEKINLEGDYIC